ncbi:MAG: DNA double-strand break repair nuclease NurA [Chloroflexi bacterium]|nr:DNA double-strand break repair nuclease NurA [Chloroflexota bacterium]
MSLDLTQLASQIQDMADRLKASERDKQEHLSHALNLLQASNASLPSLKDKVQRSKTTWLIAGLGEGLNLAYSPPPVPSAFTIIATDGSHIDVDRHGPLRCYLINIGSARLFYGKEPKAELSSQATPYWEEKELRLINPDNSNQQMNIEGSLLAARRSVAEAEAIAKLVAETSGPVLALLDGSLVLWNLESRDTPTFVREELLDRGLLPALASLKARAQSQNIALACYISFPRNTEVVNLLRLALCPYNPADCDAYCASKVPEDRACDSVARLMDRDLFAQILEPGQRSATFTSPSRIMRHYREHQMHFFYLQVYGEIARVEIPQWVAQNPDLMALTHSLLVDQCRLGQGYPVAISEAHERAVVTNADRDQFWRLVETALSQRYLPTTTSGKRQSKRGRWI